ncbi:MAG TPA: ABC transporter permease [Candidatus Binatus sp.]|uniref:ABC transporter permease n=1 Tax=Candidatus Binatus sp. TaxID=2811406 RepID=UPI002F41DB02
MKFARLIIKNLMRNERRTILTALSIAISLFVFSALVSLPVLADRILADSASSLRIAVHNKAGLAYEMPMAYAQRIATARHVVAVTPESWYGGLYHDVSDQFPNEAVDPEQAQKVWPDLVLKVFSSTVPSLGGLPMEMPPLVLIDALVVSALIGIFSAVVPASSAARRNIVDALRTGG